MCHLYIKDHHIQKKHFLKGEQCLFAHFFLSPSDIAVKPVFRHRIVPLEINIGNTAKFECETEEAPNVSFKWFKDGNPIKDGERHRIISRFSTSCLELLSPTKDDSGEYTCRASNQHGTDECSASLSVTGMSAACFLLLGWLSLELCLSSTLFLGFSVDGHWSEAVSLCRWTSVDRFLTTNMILSF